MKDLKRILAVLLSVIFLTSAAIVPAEAASLKKPKLTVKNSYYGVDINWNKVEGATKYVVLRRLSTAKKYTTLKTTKRLTFTDYKAKSGKLYIYALKAVGAKSSSVARQKIMCLDCPKISKINAVDKGGKYPYIKVNWSKTAGAKRYFVYRQSTKDGKTTALTKVATVTTNSYIDSNVESNTKYSYKIKAAVSSYRSHSSVKHSFNYFCDFCVDALHNKEHSAVLLRWDKQNGAKGYKIYRGKNGGEAELIADITEPEEIIFTFPEDDSYVTKFQYTDKDVSAGDRCVYSVIAYNGTASSPKAEFSTTEIEVTECDYVIQAGQSSPNFSEIDSRIFGTEESNLYSDDENVLKTEREKLGNLIITGVSEGYANLCVWGESNHETYRVKVVSEPVYDVELKVGESDSQTVKTFVKKFLMISDKWGLAGRATLSSDNGEVASVSEDGVISANSAGETIIRANSSIDYYLKNMPGIIIRVKLTE